MNEFLNVSTMGIADKVSRYVQARYYAVQLAALQVSVHAIGGSFVYKSCSDNLPPEVEDHLAFAIMLARETYLAPKETPVAHYQTAEQGLEDGYAIVLLHEILSALDALGLHLQMPPEGYDSEALDAERLGWMAGAKHRTAATIEIPAACPVVAAGALDALLTRFFETLPEEETRHEHHDKDPL